MTQGFTEIHRDGIARLKAGTSKCLLQCHDSQARVPVNLATEVLPVDGPDVFASYLIRCRNREP